MLFYKKVLLLKESSLGYSVSSSPVSCVFRLEQEDSVSSFNLTAVNLKRTDGEYRLFVCFDKRTAFSFGLGNRPFSFSNKVDFFPSADGGFSAGIVHILDGLPTVVAFSRSDEFNLTLKDFKKVVADYCIKEMESSAYDDEVVATENYYSAECLNEKLLAIEKLDEKYVQNKNVNPSCQSQDQKEENFKDAYFGQNETSRSSFQKYSKDFPYYLTVKDEIEKVLSSYPYEDRLNALTPDGKWVKVDYSKGKYYVVGVIKEDGKEKFVCYGVPSKYRESPPKELLGFASFVPLSVFDLKGDGYFIMFQDAVTGKSVKIN